MSQAPIWSWVPIFTIQVLSLFCHITKFLSDTIKNRKLEKGKSTAWVKDITMLTRTVQLNSTSPSQAGLKEKQKHFQGTPQAALLPTDMTEYSFLISFLISIFQVPFYKTQNPI